MNYQDDTQMNEVSTRKVPTLIADIFKAAVQFSAKKVEVGQEALKRAVSISFIDMKPRGLLQRLGAKVSRARVAWLVGSLMNQPATSLYVDNDGHGYLVTSPGAPRNISEITLMTPESLKSMSPEEVKEIHTLLVKVRS